MSAPIAIAPPRFGVWTEPHPDWDLPEIQIGHLRFSLAVARVAYAWHVKALERKRQELETLKSAIRPHVPLMDHGSRELFKKLLGTS